MPDLSTDTPTTWVATCHTPGCGWRVGCTDLARIERWVNVHAHQGDPHKVTLKPLA